MINPAAKPEGKESLVKEAEIPRINAQVSK